MQRSPKPSLERTADRIYSGSSRHYYDSIAVRNKFLILLLLTLALMFDHVVLQHKYQLLENQSLPEVPASNSINN